MQQLPANIKELFLQALEVLPIEPGLVKAFIPSEVWSCGSRPLPKTASSILAIQGYPHSGKDVIAEYICAEFSLAVRFAFSDFLIGYANEILLPFQKQIRPDTKSLVECRTLLQQLGIYLRKVDPNVLVNPVEQKITTLKAAGARLVIVTGMRDVVEYQALRALSSEIWRVYRPGNTYRAMSSIEQALDNIDDSEFEAVLYNDIEGNLTNYHRIIEKILLLKGRNVGPKNTAIYYASKL
jgi:hypothetical protein